MWEWEENVTVSLEKWLSISCKRSTTLCYHVSCSLQKWYLHAWLRSRVSLQDIGWTMFKLYLHINKLLNKKLSCLSRIISTEVCNHLYFACKHVIRLPCIHKRPQCLIYSLSDHHDWEAFSHTNSSVDGYQSSIMVQAEIRWVVLKCCSGFHGQQRMNPSDVDLTAIAPNS